jgi:hypothetical protein
VQAHSVGLDEIVTFNALDPDGYDRIDPLNTSFRIPNDPPSPGGARAGVPPGRNAITELFAVLWRIQAVLGTERIDFTRLMHAVRESVPHRRDRRGVRSSAARSAAG